MGGGAWQATVHGVTESDTTEVTSLSFPLRPLSWASESSFIGEEAETSRDAIA